MNRRFLYMTVALSAAVGIGGCMASAGGEAVAPGNGSADVTVNTSVRATGQYPESFVLTFDHDIGDAELDPALFSLSGQAGYWGSNDTRPFECTFKSAVSSGNTLTLVPADFPEKYFYVKEFTVKCNDHPEYGFTSSDIVRTVTDVADDFTTLTNENGIGFRYHLFEPEEKENMPVVIVFHGFGDTNNLLTYRTAVEWAEPENQKIRPCYVIAPVIDDKIYPDPKARRKVYAALKDILDEMITAKKADPGRIYVMGNSFGGVATIEFGENYPDSVAALIALCPALNYAPNAMTDIGKIRDVPIWFAHAQNDSTIPVSASREAVSKLKELGGKEVRFTEYTDSEMNAAGADSAPDSTYSYHHAELAVMQDAGYQEWLFEH